MTHPTLIHTVDRIVANHPRLHPDRVPVRVLRVFKGGPKDTFVKVAFPDGQTVLTHYHNVSPAHGTPRQILHHYDRVTTALEAAQAAKS